MASGDQEQTKIHKNNKIMRAYCKPSLMISNAKLNMVIF